MFQVRTGLKPLYSSVDQVAIVVTFQNHQQFITLNVVFFLLVLAFFVRLFSLAAVSAMWFFPVPSRSVHQVLGTFVHEILFLVTRPSCVESATLIKCVGASRSYSLTSLSHYALLVYHQFLIK